MASLSFRLPINGIVLLCLTFACSPLLAQEQTVYQWKDAKGVTHFADSAPAQTYKKRDIHARLGTPMEAVVAKKSTHEVSCDNARANLVKLRSAAPVGMDNNGDGKVNANLNAEQRSAQIELNEAMLKANCSTPAAKAK
jgi:hypothetical protein